LKICSDLEAPQQIASASFRSRALLKIQDGCDFACTFCVIPGVRGKAVSLEKSLVLASLRRLISQGFREVVLTGIHLCSYGRDLDPPSSLLELLRDIEQVREIGRVRLSSLDPRFLDPPLVEILTRSPKICPHFHLSLQSGSPRILRRMGRKPDVSQYREMLHRLRQDSPDAAIGADIIVGFPGEEEDDFSLTYDFLEEVPLTYFHVFSYSPRPGTLASSWRPVDEGLKKRRASRLKELSSAKNLAFRKTFIGRALNAIVIEKKDGSADALTANYIKVHLTSCPVSEGGEIQVEIEGVSARQNWGRVSLN
jgi:threonylcarbamoyladenosine tRNA methylthiotransferase MtaB